jgi:1-acyl-sn-glycerol-3-phosphate acyltransferase
MNFLKRTAQIFYCIYALVLFVAIMLLVFPFILIIALTGSVKGGNIIYKFCAFWGKLWYILVGIHHKEIYEVPHDRNKQYIFLANHISYMDIPPIVRAIHQPVRVLGKYEMVKIPIFGWIYRAAVILVDRRDAEHRAKSVRALKAALRHGISIFIFPEGTFNETEQPLKEFFDGAFRIAVETQTPIKPLLFVDTLERMHYRGFFELTPGKCRVVFLEEVPTEGLTMKDVKELKQRVHNIMEAGLTRYRDYNSKVKIQNSKD